MPKITLVSTSHIASQSIRRIKEVIKKEKPDCVAVELDPARYDAMKNNKSGSSIEMIRRMGATTFLIFYLLKYLQQKLGGMVGVIPGSDMITAVDAAMENKIDVAFVDMDIRHTAYRFKTGIPFSEKFKMISYVIKASFYISVGKYFYKGGEGFDLSKVPGKDVIEQAMEIFGELFPNLYKILITERNEIMARNIRALAGKYENTVVVIGAGHEKGIKEILEKKNS